MKKGVIKRYDNQLVVWQNLCVKKLEKPMFGSFNGCNVAAKSCDCWTQIVSRLAVNPPFVTILLRQLKVVIFTNG